MRNRKAKLANFIDTGHKTWYSIAEQSNFFDFTRLRRTGLEDFSSLVLQFNEVLEGRSGTSTEKPWL
jgi:hypothetical protein